MNEEHTITGGIQVQTGLGIMTTGIGYQLMMWQVEVLLHYTRLCVL
jgi:hypothetical protein